MQPGIQKLLKLQNLSTWKYILLSLQLLVCVSECARKTNLTSIFVCIQPRIDLNSRKAQVIWHHPVSKPIARCVLPFSTARCQWFVGARVLRYTRAIVRQNREANLNL